MSGLSADENSSEPTFQAKRFCAILHLEAERWNRYKSEFVRPNPSREAWTSALATAFMESRVKFDIVSC